jgi:hypothetical protein
MILALALVVLAVAAGTIVSYAYEDEAPLVARLGYGAASGLAALALVGFLAAEFTGIAVGTVVAAVVTFLPLLALARPAVRARVRSDVRVEWASLRSTAGRRDLRAFGPLVYAVVMAVFLILVFDRVLFANGGALYTGYVNNLGDLPFHMQVTASFAYGSNFPPEDPTYAGTGFAYPYLSDFVAAMLVNLGASFRDAFLIQNLTLAAALVILLHRFTRVLTADRLAAFIAPVLVLFSGGLGWLMLLEDARKGEHGIVAVLSSLSHDYTITGDGPYRFGNAITTLLVTQRSLLAGLPIALLIFILLWKLVRLDPVAVGWPDRSGAGSTPFLRDSGAFFLANRVAVAAGILTGALPLIHAHSFVVVIVTAFLFGLLFRQWRDGKWRAWAIYVDLALILALPQIWWSTHNSIATAGTFFGFELGWDHGDANIAWFWFLNTGLFIPLAILGGWWATRSRPSGRSAVLFCAAFLTWFIVPNVVRLAPWIWDNIKVLFYGFVGAVPLVSLALARLLRGRPSWRAAGALALASLVLAGALDVWRVVTRQSEYQEFDPNAVAIADVMRSTTAPRALILHAPTWNPPVFLTGRRSLLGYTGYIWAHGLDYADREAEIKRIYAGAPDADELLRRYGVNYVLVSPLERSYMPVNDAFFSKFRDVGDAGAYRLYEVAKA